MKHLLAILVALGVAAPVVAHHSLGATYDGTKELTLDGKIVQLLFRNPHSFITVKAPDETGAVHEWSIEWSGLPQLAGAGISASTITVGDPVVIMGNPSRTVGEHRLRMVTFLRTSDGFAWGNKRDEVVN